MAQGSFSAEIDRWVAETKARMLAVRNEAAQLVVEEMQKPVAAGGNMPVDTGFLRASLMAVKGDTPPPLRTKPDAGAFTYDAGDVALVLTGAALTDTITVAYTARYARHQEYGSRGRQGRRFVGLAAQQWGRIVDEVVAEAKGRVGA